MIDLFQQKLGVINVGSDAFIQSITEKQANVVPIDWQPPARGDIAVGEALAKMTNHPVINAANQIAFDRFLAATPVLNEVGSALGHIPNMGERMILHAGPPIKWGNMCGPMQGAIIGAILYEGWAETAEVAETLAASGDIGLEPCHHHAAVGPMAGIISPSMPVWLVVNSAQGNMAFCTLNEGLGKVLRFGANSPEVIQRLKWMEQILAPALKKALDKIGPVELKPLMAQALHMGDEIHNRNVAASSLLLKHLLPGLLSLDDTTTQLSEIVSFIAGNDHFFLNLSMAACKASLDAAHAVPHSSMVTTMARNGVEFGIRVSGTGNKWFTTTAPVVDGLFFSGYSAADAAPDLGDSAITETAGLGGFAMASAPAIVQFVGGSAQDALAYSREMQKVTLGQNVAFTLPALDFQGSPAGIDIRRVVDRNIMPIINTGIAHRLAGVGQIGAGVTRAPLACFTQAVSALGQELAKNDDV